VLSDFANVDGTGKVNALGVNWSITGLAPTGLTPPQTLVALIDIPAKLAGQPFTVCLTLLDESGAAVVPAGQSDAVRVQQLASVQRPAVPNVILPEELPYKHQVTVNFGNGLPLQPGRMYHWRLEIDGNTRPEWETSFFVAGPPPAPLIG